MFERLTARIERRARQAAAAKARDIAARIAAEAPGLRAETADGGVRISGRGLIRRHALDPALRWLVTEAWR